MSQAVISVVIPTWKRSQVVVRAVQSVLSQTMTAIDVIVVLDGPDPSTEAVLRQIDDPRLRVRILPEHAGAAAARNDGVEAAHGEWVAFLDDDDEWLPEKLARQMATAEASSRRFPIVAARVLAKSEKKQFVWPRRFPGPNEPIGDYLFCRHSLLFGEGLIPTNTVLTRRQLLLTHPFLTDLKDHEDIDWLLRVTQKEDVGVEFVDQQEPLVVWSLDTEWSRMSDRIDWRYSMNWARERKDVLSDRAYAGFLLTWLGGAAARAHESSAFRPLLREAFRGGKPRLMDLLSFAAYWSSPRRLQSRVAGLRANRSSDKKD